MAVNRGACGVVDASSGHLRRCSDADTSKRRSVSNDASLLSWPTIMDLRRCSDADTTNKCLSR
eukprot:scaffold27765_cov213-Skeletonema_marinoi.AAC.1